MHIKYETLSVKTLLGVFKTKMLNFFHKIFFWRPSGRTNKRESLWIFAFYYHL